MDGKKMTIIERTASDVVWDKGLNEYFIEPHVELFDSGKLILGYKIKTKQFLENEVEKECLSYFVTFQITENKVLSDEELHETFRFILREMRQLKAKDGDSIIEIRNEILIPSDDELLDSTISEAIGDLAYRIYHLWD